MISFNDLTLYIEEKLKEVNYELYSYTVATANNGSVAFPELSDDQATLDDVGNVNELNFREIQHDYKFKFYINGGDIIDIVNDLPPETIAVNIVDDGITQETETSLDVYLQSVNLQFLTREEYRDDLNTILKRFTTLYKSNVDVINKQQIQTIIEEYSKLSSRDFNGDQYLTGNVDLYVLIWEGIKLANTTHIFLNPDTVDVNHEPDTELQFTTLVTQRDYTVTNNMRKFDETPFSHETSTFQIDIQGLYTDTDVLRALRRDHFTNSNFGTPYRLVIRDETDAEPLLDGLFIVGASKFTQTYGQVIIYSISFIPYMELTGGSQ